MVQNLDEYLATHQPKGFRPVPHYSSQGDFVTYYFRNDPCYAERVDDLLTVFVTFDTKELSKAVNYYSAVGLDKFLLDGKTFCLTICELAFLVRIFKKLVFSLNPSHTDRLQAS